MKRDAGITEVVGAIILIAITVAGAAIVMSMIMTVPERAMPALEYYGCADNGSVPVQKCLVHQGGATLYSGQYYLRGLDEDQQPIEDDIEWNVDGCGEQGCRENFTLEDRICTTHDEVVYIQLIIADETGHSLHGTIPTAYLCKEVGGVGGGSSTCADRGLEDPPCDPDSGKIVITGCCRCPGGTVENAEGVCISTVPPPFAIPYACLVSEDGTEIQFKPPTTPPNHMQFGDCIRFIGSGESILLEICPYPYPFPEYTIYDLGEAAAEVQKVQILRKPSPSATEYAVIGSFPVGEDPCCPPGLELIGGVCTPISISVYLYCKPSPDVVQIDWTVYTIPPGTYQVILTGKDVNGNAATQTIDAEVTGIQTITANPAMNIETVAILRSGYPVYGPTNVILCGDTDPPTPTSFNICFSDLYEGKTVRVDNVQFPHLHATAVWHVVYVGGSVDVPVALVNSEQTLGPFTGKVTSVSLRQFGETFASMSPTVPCSACPPDQVWNPETLVCEACPPGYEPVNGVCEPMQIHDLAACFANPDRTLVRITGGVAGAEYQVHINEILSSTTHTGGSSTEISVNAAAEIRVALMLDGNQVGSTTANTFCEGICPPNMIVQDGVCVCIPGYEDYGDGEGCVPAPFDIYTCYGNPEGTEVVLQGGYEGVRYDVRINGVLLSATHTGGSLTRIPSPNNNKITSVSLILGEVVVSSQNLRDNLIWDDAKQACVCYIEDGWDTCEIIVSSEGFQNSPVPVGDYPDCCCVPGFYKTDGVCELITFDFDVCWAHENQAEVRIKPQDPMPSYPAVYSATANNEARDYYRGLTDPPNSPLVYSTIVRSLSLSLKSPVKFIGTKDPVNTYCDSVTCIDDDKIWNGEDCVCPPGFVDKGQGCVLMEIEIAACWSTYDQADADVMIMRESDVIFDETLQTGTGDTITIDDATYTITREGNVVTVSFDDNTWNFTIDRFCTWVEIIAACSEVGTGDLKVTIIVNDDGVERDAKQAGYTIVIGDGGIVTLFLDGKQVPSNVFALTGTCPFTCPPPWDPTPVNDVCVCNPSVDASVPPLPLNPATCRCLPGFTMDSSGKCVPILIDGLSDFLSACWIANNQNTGCISGGVPGIQYRIYKTGSCPSTPPQTGTFTHNGGTVTCGSTPPNGNGALCTYQQSGSSWTLIGAAPGTGTSQNCPAIGENVPAGLGPCRLTGPFHFTKVENSAQPAEYGCRCDYGYTAVSNVCTLIPLAGTTACYYPGSTTLVMLQIPPTTFNNIKNSSLKGTTTDTYGVPYSVCSGSNCSQVTIGTGNADNPLANPVPILFSTSPGNGPLTITLSRNPATYAVMTPNSNGVLNGLTSLPNRAAVPTLTAATNVPISGVWNLQTGTCVST